MSAFQVQDGQVNGPDWLTSEYFNVIATMPPTTTRAEYGQMMETFLVERFRLAYHRETRDDPGYELVVGKQGAKVARLKLNEEDEQKLGCSPIPTEGSPRFERHGDQMTVAVTNCPMSSAAGFLGGIIGDANLLNGGAPFHAGQQRERVLLLDKTGLQGKYSFHIEFDPDLASLQAVLQSKLGLRLVETKITREHIVVDHMDQMPTED